MNETTTEPTPARADVLRDRLLELAAAQIDEPQEFPGIVAPTLECYANAANALDQIARRAAAVEVHNHAPAINVEKLAADVWHAAQEADVLGEHFPGFVTGEGEGFAATAIADVAMAAVRKVLS